MSVENIFNFIGITIGENASCDSGICILNRSNEIIRIDKTYSIDELKDCIAKIAGKKNSIICVDMPEYYELLEGKWRIVNKATKPMKIDFNYKVIIMYIALLLTSIIGSTIGINVKRGN